MIALVAALAVCASAPPGAVAAPVTQGPRSGEAELPPIVIKASDLEVMNKPVEARRAIWKGDVRATRGDVKIRCDKLTADLSTDDRVKKLTCEGRVEAEQKDKWVAGDRAEFDNGKGVLVFTGSPRARMGRSTMTGQVIRFFVDEDRIQIDKPSGVIAPQELKREKRK